MNIAPAPRFPERGEYSYERRGGNNVPRRGPMRFQEGLGTDTDIPRDFVEGAMQGHRTAPGRINRNTKVDTKYPEETLAQRVHAGSASWVEAPAFLGEFAGAVMRADRGIIEVERTFNPEGRAWRPNPATVLD